MNSFWETSAPAISVLLPVYNGGEYLQKSVESVLAQDFADFELLVVDDASTDESFKYLESISDKRVSVFKNSENKGLFYNLNLLAHKSKSGLLKLWSQDDVMYANCLSSFVDFHRQNPDIGFSYCDRDMIDEKGAVKSDRGPDHTPSIISTKLHAQISYFTGSIAGNIANVCINKKAFDAVGPFNETMKFSADFDMLVRLAKDRNTGFIKKKIMQLRDHAKQLSRTESLYINNIKEDVSIYKYLNSYIDPEVRKEGKILLRKYKLGFYYTIMIQALFKREFKTANAYAKTLAGFDNFFLLTLAWLRQRFLPQAMPDFLREGANLDSKH